MINYTVKLGVVPTRRFIFSKKDAIKFKDLTYERLNELNVDYVDIEDINEEGLFYSEEHLDAISEKMRKNNVDALFFPHCNFGTEDIVGKLAKKMGLPVCIWGPRDDAPLPDGSRLRDSQCGLFATGKVLRRFKVPFTYIPNGTLQDASFERGIKNFIAAANVVKVFKNLRILQISTRPSDFWTMMYNEGELLEKFGIQISPVPLSDVVRKAKKLIEKPDGKVKETIEYIRENMEVCVDEEGLLKVAALKTAMRYFIDKNKCQAAAIQCWDALQADLGLMPCTGNAILTDEGIPVACETDIHGAITSVIAQAAAMGETATFFADWTVRHPSNDNGELLQHCGPYPISLCKAGTKAKLGSPFALPGGKPGAVLSEIKGGDMTILRFDGDGGKYSLLAGAAKGIEGPYIWGTYVWIEVKDWLKLEKKLVEGPYVHHCVGIHKDILPAVSEALKYIEGLDADFYDDDAQAKVDEYLLGR